MSERITVDPKVCHGQACVKGTRVPVHQIIRMLACGDTIEDLLKEYPQLKRKDILACLEYAAVLAEEQMTPLEATAKLVGRVIHPPFFFKFGGFIIRPTCLLTRAR